MEESSLLLYHKKIVILTMFLCVLSINAQTLSCNMTLAGLMACEPSAKPPRPIPPTTACCTALSHADISCLCSYKNSTALPALGIDPTLAMKLPEECKLPHPPKC
ncbi:hypothetical protein ACJIZ3_020507 [Penstemon smallii]|uniref:Bifunctional inhibitor/plant lipid transfer protein/seed storage helical domain-containing protein n=1 Tax=Penstemon smallii TaxID=265156 RepID=A0ABD3SJF9_9LAMI